MIEFLFSNPLFNLCFMVGFIFIIAGFVMLKFPPKKINSLYGYRTSQSMKTQENWDFAQKYSAKEMIKLGGLLVLCSLLVFVTNFENSINLMIGLLLMFAVVIILFIRVESAIKIRFKN